MKQIRSLIMLVIGIMAFTVTANTTATPEQKQKPDLAKELISQANDVNVVVVDFIQRDTQQIFQSNKVIVFEPKAKQKTIFTSVIDVGWQEKQLNYRSKVFKKIFADNKRNHVLKHNFQEIKIRNDC